MTVPSFNKVSSTSNFIKNLLATTYLPLIRTVKMGDWLRADGLYIYKCKIIKCITSGFLLPDGSEVKAKWKAIGEYNFGERNGKLCTAFTSNEEGYDSKTHERLGQYLRNLRDMYDLDFLPLYNCWSNSTLSYHYIDPDKLARTDMDLRAEVNPDDPDPITQVHGDVISKTSQTHNTIIYKIPIRFNQDYTICIENPGLTTIAPAFLQYDTLMKWNNSRYGDGIDVTNKFIKLHHTQNVVNKAGLRFQHPITFRVDNVPTKKKIRYFEYHPLNWIYRESDETLVDGDPSTMGPLSRYSDDPFVFKAQLSAMVHHETAIAKSVVDWEIEKYYTYDIKAEHCDMYEQVEDHLYMLIQVPAGLESSIVVLEGDYTDRNINKEKLVTLEDIDNLPTKVNEWLFNDNLTLMRMNTKKATPFSKHLLQYLLWHAINHMETIEGNGWLLKNKYGDAFCHDGQYFAGGLYDWFDNVWRKSFFEFGMDDEVGYVEDNTGYLTTRIEEVYNRTLE